MSFVAFQLTTEAVLSSLLAARGTAYDTDTGSTVYAECEAFAMAIASAWDTNRRLACQFDPQRMTDFLPRWERIFRLRPARDATDTERRAAVAAKFSLIGQMPNAQGVTDLLSRIMPDTFVGIVNTPSTSAQTHVPNGANIPGGINVTADGIWASSIAHIAIDTDQPATMTEADYHAETGGAVSWLDDFLPAWTTFATFQDGALGVGFFLDQAENLDEQRFSP